MAKTKKKFTLEEPLELEGRTLEGGGQLIRIAFCLSALTKRPIQVNNIRGNRAGSGGLRPQHLACVHWLAIASNARLSGAGQGSRQLLFHPGKIESGDVPPAFDLRTLKDGSQIYESRMDIGTAGSTGLALQAVLPLILFSDFPLKIPIHLRLSGGTNVSASPSFECIKYVLLPTLHRIGFPEIKATLHKRGWSQGGSTVGSFTLEIPPRQSTILPAFTYRPDDTASYTPALPSHLHAIFVAPSTCHDHFKTALIPALSQHFSSDFTTTSSNLTITCEGSLHEKRFYFILIATISTASSPSSSATSPQDYTIARDWLYDKKISHSLDSIAGKMVEKVTGDLAAEWRSGTYVDEHMRDQLVIFQALAEGRSEVFPGRYAEGELCEPSLHARTAEWVAKEVLGVKFDFEGSCEGVGFGGDDVDGLGDEVQILENGVGNLVL